MNFFKQLFSGSSNESNVQLPWKELNSLNQLAVIKSESLEKPVVIFKHSTRCGISSMTLRRFESQYDLPEEAVNLYYLDLIANRQVSNQVAAEFQVLHQSPQLLIIRNETAVYNASHSDINSEDIKRFI